MSSHEVSNKADAEIGGNEATGTEDQQQVVVEKEKRQRATRAKKSPVWLFFEEVRVPSKKKKGEIEIKGKCMACQKLFAKTASGTTSHWMRHLTTCDRHKLNQKSKQQKIINFRTEEEEEAEVSSESAFSTGGRVVDDYRSSLLPSTVQCLVCTSSWIRGGHHKEKDMEDDANSIPLVLVEEDSLSDN